MPYSNKAPDVCRGFLFSVALLFRHMRHPYTCYKPLFQSFSVRLILLFMSLKCRIEFIQGSIHVALYRIIIQINRSCCVFEAGLVSNCFEFCKFFFFQKIICNYRPLPEEDL